MRLHKIVYVAAFASLCCLWTGCSPDTGGNGNPVTGARIWVADQPDKEVVMYDADGNLIKVVGGRSTFSKPNSIAIYRADGSAWVSDFYTNRIRKFDAGGNPVYASPGEEAGFLVLNPTGLAVSQSSGECWVADRGNNRVIRLGADGAVLARVSGFRFPRGVAVDPVAGDVWVADESNDAVVKISGSASGNVGVGAVETGRFTDLAKPWAVAADGDGKGWACSRAEGRVVRLSSDAAELASVGGFGEPVALAVDEVAKAVYVVDTQKGVLVALPLSLTGTHNGYAAAANFVVAGLSHPEGVFADEDNGRVYVAEMGGGAVRIYDSQGEQVKVISGFSGAAVVAAWEEN
jgi:DNA-binding beta-propeller fold protein YncE